MGRLAGRRALVTGAGRNIGRATALAFAREGADVVVHVRANEVEAREVAEEVASHGVRSRVVIADLADLDELRRMAREVQEAFGGIDIFYANAAIRPRKPFDEVTYEDLRHTMAVNFESTFALAQAFSRGMRDRGWGRIITNVGLNSYTGQAERFHATAAKMATLGLTRALSKEFAPDGVLVNGVSPGYTDTSRVAGREAEERLVREKAPGIPVGRLGRPEEIANLVLFLASDEASFISGQLFAANGGELSM
jgi:3-oxoacyl-[acyl-carrier protein] reductase